MRIKIHEQNMPKFTIITINYNNFAGLKRTIDSVIHQTFSDFEFIIIDGGSTDGSKELIEQHKDRIAYWCSEPDSGVYNAMNKGIDHAKGKYINFMNSGDTFYNETTLEEVQKEKLTADIIYGDWIKVFSDHHIYNKAKQYISIAPLYRTNVSCHQAMFIRNEAHKKERYDEHYKILADYALWLNMALKGYSFQYIPVTICRYEAGGLSETYLEKRKEEGISLREAIPLPVKRTIKEYYVMEEELTSIGPKIRKLLQLRKKNPFFSFLIKLCLSVPYLFAKIIYKKNF